MEYLFNLTPVGTHRYEINLQLRGQVTKKAPPPAMGSLIEITIRKKEQVFVGRVIPGVNSREYSIKLLVHRRDHRSGIMLDDVYGRVEFGDRGESAYAQIRQSIRHLLYYGNKQHTSWLKDLLFCHHVPSPVISEALPVYPELQDDVSRDMQLNTLQDNVFRRCTNNPRAFADKSTIIQGPPGTGIPWSL